MPARKHGIACKAGLPPESLVHVGHDYGGEARVRFRLRRGGVRERDGSDLAGLQRAAATDGDLDKRKGLVT
jgi:hypothetical protein